MYFSNFTNKHDAMIYLTDKKCLGEKNKNCSIFVCFKILRERIIRAIFIF